MRRVVWMALLAMAFASPVRAQEIRVLGAALSTGGGLREVGDAFTKKTGVKVTLVTGGMETLVATTKTGTPPVDLVMMPMDLMGTLALDHGIKPGSFTALGRMDIGLFKKPDAPFPDITTVEKLAAVLKAATVVTYTDPASGSRQALISAELLKRPEFAGVKGATGGRKPTATSPDGTMSLGIILGEPDPPLGKPSPTDPSLIGRLPAELGAFIDLAVAISARTADAKNAQAFLEFLTSAEAVPLFAAKGTTIY